MLRTQTIETIAANPDFRPLASIAGIGVELRYATPNNFVGRDLYSPIDCAWLHRNAAEGLEKSVSWLQQERPALRPLVLDALRPQRVQEQLWEALQGTDLLGYLANSFWVWWLVERQSGARLDSLVRHGRRHHTRGSRRARARHGHTV